MAIDFVLIPATDNRQRAGSVTSSFFFDPAHVRVMLSAAGRSGFAAVVIDDAAGPLANVDIAANVARWNPDLNVVLTHWADITSPAVAAADFALLDRLAGGRLSLRIVPEGTETNSYLRTWQRTDEYLTLLQRLWTNDAPIDHEGWFYSLKEAIVQDKGPRGHRIPVRLSGRTGKAIDIAARHATVFELPEADLGETAGLMNRVLSAAGEHGRADSIAFARPLHADGDLRDLLQRQILPYAAIGVSEFLVTGTSDTAAIERFGSEIIAPIRAYADWLSGKTARPAEIDPAWIPLDRI